MDRPIIMFGLIGRRGGRFLGPRILRVSSAANMLEKLKRRSNVAKLGIDDAWAAHGGSLGRGCMGTGPRFNLGTVNPRPQYRR